MTIYFTSPNEIDWLIEQLRKFVEQRVLSENRRILRSIEEIERTGIIGLRQIDRIDAARRCERNRFLDDLLQTGRYEKYMALLVNSFNRDSVEGLMCRSTISIDWQGNLFDCDFNQMLNLSLVDSLPRHISSVRITDIENRPIAVGRHCYGCTAGQGSSCGGALEPVAPQEVVLKFAPAGVL